MVSKQGSVVALTVTQTGNDVTGTIRELSSADEGICFADEAIAITHKKTNATRRLYPVDVSHWVAPHGKIIGVFELFHRKLGSEAPSF
jgi:hypothetical protein